MATVFAENTHVLDKMSRVIEDYDMVSAIQIRKVADATATHPTNNKYEPDYIDLLKEIGTLDLDEVKEYSGDIMKYDVADGVNRQNLVWLLLLVRNNESSSIAALIEPAFEKLDIHHRNGAVYLKMVLDLCFSIDDHVIESLKVYITRFGKNGLSAFEGENVNMAAVEIIAIARRLDQLSELPNDAPKSVLKGLQKVTHNNDFKQYDSKGKPKVLSLLCFLYGLRNSPRAFWQYLTKKLEACGLQQSKLDPCLFIGTHVIVVTYVDDVLFWSDDEKHIYDLGTKLREANVDLEEESDAAGFLGVDLVRMPGGRIHMKQPGLIKRIIAALGFDESETTSKKSPAERNPLIKDEEGEMAQESFSYASVVGMLLYLAGHTRPDLCYSVSQAARFMFAPKRSHEVALKRIGRYLVGTADKGIIMDPQNATSLHIDAYPDADFAGLYGYGSTTDPVCVRSRTCYIIAVSNCPVVVYSSLQTETALSTMQAEIYAMAQCCKALFPLIEMVKELSGAAGLPLGGPPQMKITLHEDNSGALILAKTIPPEFTPRSKFYALKTIWFREQIAILGIEVIKVDTKLQWEDICTKMPPVVTFEFLRKLIMGW